LPIHRMSDKGKFKKNAKYIGWKKTLRLEHAPMGIRVKGLELVRCWS
jgi:hypothetical protein